MILFLTLYLGLISGKQPVALQVDGAVKSVRILIDGAAVATIDGPPWRTDIDFGPALLPHEIVAVGLNAKGEEIARAAQFANIPRRIAELDVALAHNARGAPVRAALVARHLAQEKVRSADVKLDGKELALDKDFAAKLPALDMLRPHVLVAEMRFADGSAARREVVFGGQFGESTQAQLTPLAVAAAGNAQPAEGCFAADGVPLRVGSVEQSTADVVIVRDPGARNAYAQARRGSPVLGAQKSIAALDAGTFAQMLSPIARHVAANEEAPSLFPTSDTFDLSKSGLFFALSWSYGAGEGGAARQWADAVAVAGVMATAGGRRRAVVLVLGDEPDASHHQPTSVRRYLDALGVPLFVWSVSGPRPELAASWGPVDDVSTIARLTEASERIRRTLAAQRIVWIATDPLTALRAKVKEGCGYTPLAK